MNFLLLTLILSTTAFAQGVDNPFKVKPDKSFTEEDLKTRREILLQEDEIIADIDKVVGVRNTDHFTKWDKTRLTASFHTAADITKVAAMQGFDIKFSRKMQTYTNLWWSFNVKKTLANFDQITENPTSDASAPSGSDRFPNNARPATSQQDVMQIGLGVAYRFKFLFPWRDAPKWFEEIHVLVNSVSHTDSFSKNQYSGYGLTTEYEIYKRSSKKFFWGGKLSYNIADVTREVPSTYDKNDGRLLLAWMSLGINMGFFF